MPIPGLQELGGDLVWDRWQVGEVSDDSEAPEDGPNVLGVREALLRGVVGCNNKLLWPDGE